MVIESPTVEHTGMEHVMLEGFMMGSRWWLIYPAENLHQLRTLFYQKGCQSGVLTQ